MDAGGILSDVLAERVGGGVGQDALKKQQRERPALGYGGALARVVIDDELPQELFGDRIQWAARARSGCR